MALSPGTRLGPFEILAPLGAGGMGEVYRAKDRKLGRQVAVKVLPEELSSNPERLKRFEREARAASSLNHPNTVTIHDIDEQDGIHYIAMELVEGTTLRDRLGEGPLPAAEMLPIAAQVAAGLARAHAAGIVHRDLKPGNIMVTEDGLVKILDFGLAKVGAGAERPSELSTVQEVTREGAILGTAPYMSPEQAAGRPLDFRSDQFSFGSILYEMATGKRAFEKGSSPETLAAIIEAAPTPVGALNDRLPPPVVAIIERCLSRDPRGRYDSTGDLAKELARASSASPDSRSRRWLPAAGLIALAGLAAVGVYWRAAEPDDAPSPAAPLVAVPLTSYPGREAEPTFSPDGSQVAFSWDGESQDNRDIYVKAIGSEQPLRLTIDAAQDGSPAWSPDGRLIALLRDRGDGGSELLLVSPTGGPERRLAEVQAPPDVGLAWLPDGRHLVVPDRVTPDGSLGLTLLEVQTGSKERLTGPDSGIGDRRPALSPDGRWVAFKRIETHGYRLAIVPVTGGDARFLSPTHGIGSVAWARGGGQIIFAALPETGQDSELPSTRPYSGSALVLWGIAPDGSSPRQLAGTSGCEGAAVSLAGRLACTQRSRDTDIWRLALRGAAPTATRFASSTRADANPEYSPDGGRVAFTSMRTGSAEIWAASADGSDLLQLTSVGHSAAVGSPRWSPDGEWVAFDSATEGEGRNNPDIYVVSASGGPSRQVTTAASPDFTPSWSRDGRWIYFSSNRDGTWQVWKVPSTGEREGTARQVTRGGGFAPMESPDGRLVYFARRRSSFANPRNAIWSVPVEGGDEEPVVEALGSSFGNWGVADEGIYFVDRDTSREDAPWMIRLLDFAGGQVRVVAPLPHSPEFRGPAFSVSPDGRFALSMRAEAESDLMLFEGFR